MSLQRELGRVSLLNIPDLDKVISRSSSQDVRGRGMEDDLSDFTGLRQLGYLTWY